MVTPDLNGKGGRDDNEQIEVGEEIHPPDGPGIAAGAERAQ